MKKYLPHLSIILAGLSWATIGFFTKVLTQMGISEIQMMFLKVTIGAFIIAIIIAIRDKNAFKLKKLSDIKYFIGSGIISYSFFSYYYMLSINEMSIGMAAMLLYTSPIFVMIFSRILFKEKFTKVKIISLILTLFGCFLVAGVFTKQIQFTKIGIIYGLFSAIGYGLYGIFGKLAIEKGYDSFTISFYTFLTSTLVFSFLIDPILLLEKIDKNNIFLIIVFVLMTAIIPYIAYNNGLKHLKPGTCSILVSIELVGATIMGIVIFKESFNILKLLGVASVLAAVIILSREEKTKEQ
ncbi:MAG: DMT family transporter [Tissierellia bacterium]|nr:DMT family transporter [Tissierellia bacterium]